MTKAKISEYDAVAANNTDVNGVNIDEGCAPSGMNNMGREIMAALKRFETGADGDSLTVGGNLIVSGTVTAANTATLGNVDVNGGTIDGAVIGGSTPAAGSFTTLNTSGAVVFNDAGADVDFRVEGDTDANLLFVDASTDRVGIGTSSPATKFHVSNTSGATQVQVSSDTDVSFSATATGADSTAFMTVLNDARQWTIRVNGSESDQFQIRDSTAGATRMVIDSSGNVGIANGNLVFSTNGTGIDFSASAGGGATSSILDDYEEGTFTITFTPTTSGTATANASYNTMSYTKIGNMVTIFGNPRVSSVGSPVGELYLNGLPFAVASTTNISRGGVSITYLVFGTGYKAVPILAIETTTYLFIFTTSVGATVAAGDEMLISFSYRTT
jgi:hypothetical protein